MADHTPNRSGKVPPPIPKSVGSVSNSGDTASVSTSEISFVSELDAELVSEIDPEFVSELSPDLVSELVSELEDAIVEVESTLPDASSETAFTEIYAFLAEELTAGKEAGVDSDILVELSARIALLLRDTTEDFDACLLHCTEGKGHPLVIRLLCDFANGAATAEQYKKCSEMLAEAIDGQETALCAPIYSKLAESWLYGFENAEKAKEMALKALEATETPSPSLCRVYSIALSNLGNWRELIEFHSSRESTEDFAVALQVTIDRLPSPNDAAAMAKELWERSEQWGLYASSIEVQLLLETGAEASEHVALLERRYKLLQELAPSSVEANATRFSLAEVMEQAGQEKAAQEAFVYLSSKTGWSTSIALQGALRLGYKRKDWKIVESQLAKMASIAKEEALVCSHRRRRADILEHRLNRKTDSLREWQKISQLHPEDEVAQTQLVKLLLPSPKELVVQILSFAGRDAAHKLELWRLAAALSETRLKEMDEALDLTNRVANETRGRESWEGKERQLTRDLFEVARIRSLCNQSKGVSTAYTEIARLEGNQDIAISLLFVASLAELKIGDKDEARELLQQAKEHSKSTDLSVSWMLGALYREDGEVEELRSVLEEIATHAISKNNQFDALIELGTLCTKSKDLVGARAAMAKANELRPDDAELTRVLAGLHEENEEWEQAVTLLRKSAEQMPEGPDLALVYQKIGYIEKEHRDQKQAAIDAYENGLRIEPNQIECLRACQELYASLGNLGKELEMSRAELAIAENGSRRLELLLAIGAASAKKGEPVAKTLQSYQQALMLDPNSPVGLAGLFAVASENKNFDVIADAYAGASDTPENLRILYDACVELSDWSRAVDAKKRILALQETSEEKVEIQLQIASIYQDKVSDVTSAIVCLQSAIDLQPERAELHATMRKVLEDESLWPELVLAIASELNSVSLCPENREHQLQLRLQWAKICDEKLQNKADAALAYEGILEIDPNHAVALKELETLYSVLERDSDLLRVKVKQLNTVATSELTHQIAELRIRTGDVDGAIKAYFAAFFKEISNREMFSTVEKICYSHERWDDVMVLYTDVISRVENGDTKAYRLGDLYARRGQVQLQFKNQPVMAAASFLRVIEIEPTDINAMESIAKIFSESKDWDALIAAYEKRAELCGDTQLKIASFREAAKIAKEHTNDLEEVARFSKALLELEPSNTAALARLEEYYTETKNWNELVSILETKLEIGEAEGTVDVDLLKQIAKLSEVNLRDENRAILYYNRVVELVPQSRRSLDALARIYESTEKWMEFVDVTRRLVKVTKDRNVKALLYFKCGSVTEAKFGNEEDAIRYYDAAIKTSPSCLPAVHGLRDLYLRRKEWARVIQTLELEVKLWQDDKERAGVFAQIGRIYGVELGESERALGFYERALAVDPKCMPANRAMFEHYFDLGRWELAEPLAHALAPKAMRDGDPMRRSEFYRKRGIVFKNTGDPVSAVENIAISLNILPENLEAVQALVGLAKQFPRAYEYASTFRELSKIYRKQSATENHLAHVMVGEAQIQTWAGNLQTAEDILKQAIDLSFDNIEIVSALVDLHASMRKWEQAVEVLEQFLTPTMPIALQREALMKMAEIYSDGAMDSERAVAALLRILNIDANNPEVHYLLAQELYCLQRFDEARGSIERVIELSAAPAAGLSAQQLARYYYFLGHVLERAGETRSAVSKYRRAAEYDPGYAPPALALAMHSMRGGDQPGAESRLINAALAAIEQGERSAAVPLQRGLARILLNGGDQDAAIEAYRGILEVEPSGAADRLSLAEIYAQRDLQLAISEVRRVIELGLRHGPAYRVLAGYYMLANEFQRALRVLITMRLLGYSEEKDEQMASLAQSKCTESTLHRPLTPELRMTLLANDASRSVLAEFYAICYQQMGLLNQARSLGENLTALPSVDNPVLKSVAAEVSSLFGVEAEIYVGEQVPGSVIVIAHPRQIVVLDHSIATQSKETLQFVLGWAVEGIRSGFASLLHLRDRQRSELAVLMRSLFLPQSKRTQATNEFIASLPAQGQELLGRFEGDFQDLDMELWIDGMNAVARRAGLLACNDLTSSSLALALMSGETVHETYSALGTVFCGEDLFQFHVSDNYDRLRMALSTPEG